MACKNITTLLAFDDEVVTEKNKHYLNFTTNKLGGKPDLPSSVKLETQSCPLCQLPRPLVLQIYAPLENSTYHRTLYIFACINPNCWNHNESWLCLRTQSLEQVKVIEETTSTNTSLNTTSVTDWCKDADDWGDDNLNANEENGNVISNLQEKGSDEDDESCSFEESMRAGFENLNVDDKNANCAEGGAVGSSNSPTPSAEIEGNEGEVISIDTPTFPQNDIISFLHEVTPLPQNLCNSEKSLNIQFVPHFLSVTEELSTTQVVSDRHVQKLLQEYQLNNEGDLENFEEGAPNQAFGHITENYEESMPHHGDKMFDYFKSKIQLNPGQILRYSRGMTPLLLYPLQSIPKKCEFCQGEMVFEFQILPTLIPKLKLCDDARQMTRVEFGNVLIFTCRKSCWSTDAVIRQEAVIVQAEMM